MGNCKRRFLFDGDCTDAMGLGDGTGDGLIYDACDRYTIPGTTLRELAADFSPDRNSLVNIGSAADIDNLLEFSISFWTYCRSLGDAPGLIFWKGGNTRFQVSYEGGALVGLYGKIGASTTHAESAKAACLEKNEWHHVCFKYSDSGDRRIHIFIDASEVSGYGTYVAAVGTRNSDAAEIAYIGNSSGGTTAYDGLITSFHIDNVYIQQDVLAARASCFVHEPPAELFFNVYEDWCNISSSRAPLGIVTFQFDDGYASIVTKALPIFAAAGKKAVAAVVTDLIGTGGRLSSAQILTLHAAGWDIASHSKTHADPITLSEAQLRDELSLSRAAIRTIIGTHQEHFAWPYSCPGETFRQICRQYYNSAADGSSPAHAEFNRFAIGHVTIDDPAGLAGYKVWIASAKAWKGYLTFIMHDLGDDDLPTLTALLAECTALGVPVRTRTSALTYADHQVPALFHGAANIRLDGTEISSERWFQRILPCLAHTDYVVSFMAYAGGHIIDETVLTLLPISIDPPHFTPMPGGIYYVWGAFNSGALTSVLHGLSLQPGKLIYLSEPRLDLLPAAP